MTYAAHLAGTAVACYLTATVLLRSNWTSRSPRVAIICWQAIGLALGLCAIGLPMSIGLAAYDEGIGGALLHLVRDLWHGTLPAGLGVTQLALVGVGFGIATALLGSTVRGLVSAVRVQTRHRQLLDLVGRDDPAAPGALVLDHPSAAAYCLPGMRPTVVVSAGTLDLLDRSELAAVLTHERAHADERHDLVLLPFSALCRALPLVGWLRRASETVALLVEMRADDKARRLHAEGPLANALLRFATAGSRVAPAGALGLADAHLDARVQRLLVTGPRPWVRGLTSLAVATTLVALPITLFFA
ncbi:M56 family metallopeptidase [Micromonospora sp. NPDC049523]|uniref:M56 family metallopeptidase n=1 Tax=Micromonospora sp. NPDC049523 TaxID=3155921 RepID=UPI003440D9E0